MSGVPAAITVIFHDIDEIGWVDFRSGDGSHLSTGMENTSAPARGPELDRRVAAQAEDHHGLVLRADVRALGADSRMERWRVDQRAWVPVAPGVWRIAGAPVTWEQCLTAGLGRRRP